MGRSMGITLVVFVSYPFEAALSAIARGIEVLDVDKLVLVSTSRWRSEVEALRSCLEGSVVRKVVVDYGFPDPLIDPYSFGTDVARKRIENILGSEENVCIATSSGSHLEISTALEVLKPRCSVYVMFGWGPWRGAFYPYTPRPLQLAYIDGEYPARDRIDSSLTTKIADALRRFLSLEPRFRRAVLEQQLAINMQIQHPLAFPYGSRYGSTGCLEVSISISIDGRTVVAHTIDDYCDMRKVVDGVTHIGRRIAETCLEELSLSRSRKRASSSISLLSTIARFSGLLIPAASDSRRLLIDIAREIGDAIAIDTNLVFDGIHSQLYEYPEVARRLVEPLCLELEVYTKLAEARDDVSRVEAEIGRIGIEELHSFPLVKDYSASYTPCEVSLYLSRYIVATGDRVAYEGLLKKRRDGKTILIESLDLKSVDMGSDTDIVRRASYAYYAIAQLASLRKMFEKELARARIGIEIRWRKP